MGRPFVWELLPAEDAANGFRLARHSLEPPQMASNAWVQPISLAQLFRAMLRPFNNIDDIFCVHVWAHPM